MSFLVFQCTRRRTLGVRYRQAGGMKDYTHHRPRTPPVEYPDIYFRLHQSPSALRGSGLRALPSQAGHSQAIARRGSAAETS